MTLSRPSIAVGLTPFAILAIGYGAARSPKYCALAVVALIVVVVTFSSLPLGLTAFTVVTFFNTLPSGSALNLAKPTGFILTLSWLAALLKYRRAMPLLSRDHPVLTTLLVAFFGWAGISLVWADDVGRVISSLSRLALALIFVFIVHSTVRTGRELRILAWAFVIGTGLSALYGFAWGLTVDGRFVGGSGDANFMASVLVASIVISGFMLAATSSFGARLLLLALVALDFLALVKTQSRGGLIALAVAIVAACVLAGRLRARVVAISLVVVALGIGYYAVLAPAEVRARATHISAAGSAGRTDLWAIAWQITQNHPVNGVGLDNFQAVESSYVTRTFNILDVARLRRLDLVTHNTYLQLLAELGSVGLVLLTAVLAVSVALAVGALRLLALGPDRRTEAIARGVTAGSIGVLTAYIFLSGLYEKQFWLLLGILAALPTVAREVQAPSSGS